MFKLGHTSDFHFGRTKHSGLDSSTGLQTSLVNDMEVFNEFIDVSEKENVDIFIMAGDVFDKIHVSNAVRKEVAKCFRRILEKRHLYVIVGTHDRAHDKYAAHTLSDWMNLSGGDSEHMSRLHVFEYPSSVLHLDGSGQAQAQIIALPEPTKGLLEGLTYTAYIEDFFKKIEIRSDIPVVVIGHFSIVGAKKGDEVNDVVGFRSVESIDSKFFDDRKDIDYVALGHIHLNQELGKTGKIVYPGSLNYCSFTEVNLRKGGYICTVSDDKKLEKKFVELSSPIPLIELRIDVRDVKSPMEMLRGKIGGISLHRSIVKLVLTIDEEQYKMVDEKEIEDLLSSAISFSYTPDIKRPFKVRDASITKEAASEEVYPRYIDLLDYSQDIKEEMLAEFDCILNMSNGENK